MKKVENKIIFIGLGIVGLLFFIDWIVSMYYPKRVLNIFIFNRVISLEGNYVFDARIKSSHEVSFFDGETRLFVGNYSPKVGEQLLNLPKESETELTCGVSKVVVGEDSELVVFYNEKNYVNFVNASGSAINSLEKMICGK